MKLRRWLFRGAWAAAALIVAVPLAYGRMFPLPTRYADDVEHFKYGSVGVEAAQGVPYEVWRTLPGVCMDPAHGPGAARGRLSQVRLPVGARPLGAGRHAD
jgi:hypothetical protein